MDDAAPGQRLQLAVECQCGPHRGHERALPGVLTRGTPYLTFTLPCLHQEYVVMVEGAIASTLEELECKADEIDRWTDRESRGLS